VYTLFLEISSKENHSTMTALIEKHSDDEAIQQEKNIPGPAQRPWVRI
jgi:hypothetical protein